MKKFVYRHASILILLLFIVILSIFLSFNSSSFLSWKNMVNIFEATSYRMILAVGMTFIIASGCIDLSIGAIISLSAILMAMAMKAGVPVAVSIIICLVCGAVLGLINGSLVYSTRVNSLVVTLGTSSIYRGLALILTLGTPISRFPDAFRSFGYGDILGMESGVWMAAIILIIAFPLMYRMRWGHYLTALGSNSEALSRSGVRTVFYRVGSFVMMGVLAALCAVIITARLNSAEPNAGLSMEMDAIAAVIMGGTPLNGGTASVAGTAVAVILLGLIRNGLTLMSISSYYQQFITGILLLLAVVLAELRQRRQRQA